MITTVFCDTSAAASLATIIRSRCPEIPCYLNELLACEDFQGGIEPKIGQKHIRVIAVDGFPKLSSPGILRELDSLPIEYRWNTRAILIDPEEARGLLDGHRKKWRSKARGWKDQIFRTQNGPVNLHAQEMSADAEVAMGVAASGDVQFCQYSANIICMDDDPDRLYESTRLVMKTVQNLGFSCRVETVNAVEAWRGVAPRRRVQQRASRAAAHDEPRRHAPDHIRMGRASGKSQRLDAEA